MTDASTTLAPPGTPDTSSATTVGKDAYAYIWANAPNLAWMLTVPELAGVVNQIMQGQVTDPNIMQGLLQKTNWWQTLNDSAKSFYQLQALDPAQAAAKIQADKQAIQATVGQLGIRMTDAQLTGMAYGYEQGGWTQQELENHVAKGIVANPDGSFSFSPYYIDPGTGKEIDTATGREAYYGPEGEPATPTKPTDMTGWASAQQADGTTVYYHPGTSDLFKIVGGVAIDQFTGRQAYYGPNGEPATPDLNAANSAWGAGNFQTGQFNGQTVYYKPGTTATAEQGGTLQATQQQLQSLAKQYMVNVSPQALAQWSAQIASGQQTTQGFQSYAQNVAMGQFPWMTQGIQEGQTPLQLVSPYANMVQSELGIDANNIDWTQPKWAKLLTSTDPKSGSLTQTPLWQATKTLRSDPSYGWQYTPNAKSAAYDLIQGLQQAMGFRNYSGASVGTPGAFGSTGG